MSSPPPILSIITINRNNAIGLKNTIAGFREWRLPEVEFVFVDGASTDASLSIAHDFYQQEEIRSEADRGIYHAMNKGILRSTGMFLLFLNSGDCILQGSADVVLKALRFSEVDIETFGTRIRWTCRNNAIEEFNPGPAALPRFTLPHQSTFFRRKMVLKLDGYDEDFHIAGDRDLILRLHRSGASIRHHPEFIADYYSGGVSSSAATVFEDLWIDVKQGRRSFVRLMIDWLRRPPGPEAGRFFTLATRQLIRLVRPQRRLTPARSAIGRNALRQWHHQS